MEVAPVHEVSRAEEGGPKLSAGECPLRNRLGDGTLPRSGQSIQPVDGGFIEIPCPELDLVQDNSTSSLETTFAAAMAIFSGLRTAEIVEDNCFSC